jgi:alpha-beta hydrolase superfamily lysophospholipase
MKKTIVFIHGMFQNSKSWDKWVNHFQQLGYNCIAPSWPDHDGEPAALRANPPATLGDLMLEDVIGAIEQVIIHAGGGTQDVNEKPIIIGHSVGGLLAQIFVNKNLASLAVPICPVAPNKMMTLDWPFFKNVAAITNPFKGDEPFKHTAETFQEGFCNTLDEASAQAAFEDTATYDSRNVLRGCLGEYGEIALDTPHVPMLFIAAKEDQIIPYELVEKTYNAYKDEEVGDVSYQVFENKSHFICGEPGWEVVAEQIHSWIQQNEKSVGDSVL